MTEKAERRMNKTFRMDSAAFFQNTHRCHAGSLFETFFFFDRRNLMTIRSALIAAAFSCAALGSFSALAQPAQPAYAAHAAQAGAPALNIRQIYDRVEAAGYVNIREIELEKYGYYKVKARNAQGDRVKLHVNAQTGAIERNRFDD